MKCLLRAFESHPAAPVVLEDQVNTKVVVPRDVGVKDAGEEKRTSQGCSKLLAKLSVCVEPLMLMSHMAYW